MKKNGILCILIAAALLVTSVAAISAQDQTAIINQIAGQENNNDISGTMPNIAVNSSFDQTINSMNNQNLRAAVVQTGDTVAVGGDIRDSNIIKGGVGNQTPNQTATIGQLATQLNNNTIVASPADRATITVDVVNVSWGNVDVLVENLSIQLPNVVLGSSNDQTINSMNNQILDAQVLQTGDTVAAVGDIRDSNIYSGPIEGNSGPTPTPTPTPPTPPTPPGPAGRP